jgi:regulator of replication initiation timing
MTAPKTVLVAALLLTAAAAAQWTSLQSTGPYDVRPGTSFQYYLLWFPPHAVPMNLTFLNATWSRPEAIWFKGTYPVRVCEPGGCRYVPATIYVVQDGVRVVEPSKTPLGNLVTYFVEWHIRRICAQGTAMVAPNKIIVLDYTTQIWISDVYCLHGNNWFWLRLLPYILRDELTVEGVEAVNFTDTRVYVRVPAKPPGDHVIPAGWYLDSVTKRVFRIPNDTAVMAELQKLRMRISDLETELANKTAQLTQLNMTVAQLKVALAEAREEAVRLSAENERLRAQLEALNYTRARLETEAYAYRSQLEALRAVETRLAQLTAENQALKAQIFSMNKTLAELNETYASKLRSEIETWTRAAWIGAALGAAAGAAVTAIAFRRRR